MPAKTPTRCIALIVLAAYSFALFGSPPVSYADEKSSKGKSETERWRRNNRLLGESLSTEFKIILVATGALLVVTIIYKIAKADGDDDETKSEVQKTSEAQVDSSQVFSVRPQTRHNEQKSSPYLLGRKPLILSED